jgi:ANTAR domain
MPARSHLTFANGILMERYMITAAFLALTRVSQTSNRKLYDVADELIRQSVISDVAGPSRAPPVSLELARSDGSRSEPPDLVQTGSGYPAEPTPSMP